jgi:hypothetical protein
MARTNVNSGAYWLKGFTYVRGQAIDLDVAPNHSIGITGLALERQSK